MKYWSDIAREVIDNNPQVDKESLKSLIKQALLASTEQINIFSKEDGSHWFIELGVFEEIKELDAFMDVFFKDDKNDLLFKIINNNRKLRNQPTSSINNNNQRAQEAALPQAITPPVVPSEEASSPHDIALPELKQKIDDLHNQEIHTIDDARLFEQRAMSLAKELLAQLQSMALVNNNPQKQLRELLQTVMPLAVALDRVKGLMQKTVDKQLSQINQNRNKRQSVLLTAVSTEQQKIISFEHWLNYTKTHANANVVIPALAQQSNNDENTALLIQSITDVINELAGNVAWIDYVKQQRNEWFKACVTKYGTMPNLNVTYFMLSDASNPDDDLAIADIGVVQQEINHLHQWMAAANNKASTFTAKLHALLNVQMQLIAQKKMTQAIGGAFRPSNAMTALRVLLGLGQIAPGGGTVNAVGEAGLNISDQIQGNQNENNAYHLLMQAPLFAADLQKLAEQIAIQCSQKLQDAIQAVWKSKASKSSWFNIKGNSVNSNEPTGQFIQQELVKFSNYIKNKVELFIDQGYKPELAQLFDQQLVSFIALQSSKPNEEQKYYDPMLENLQPVNSNQRLTARNL